MKTLVVLRGSQRSGKSSLIKRLKLEPYTISTDDLRLKFSNPINLVDGSQSISQKYNKKVFDILYELLEYRMSNGMFTIIDMTTKNNNSLKKIKDLVEKYNYRAYYYEMKTTLEECLINNNYTLRQSSESFRYVSPSLIEKTYNEIKENKISNPFKELKTYHDFVNIFNSRPFNFDYEEFSKLIVIGDIHGSYTALKELIDLEFHENGLGLYPMLVFVGDFLDRGIENQKTIEYLIDLKKKYPNNFIFIEGNHEAHLRNYIKGEEIKSKKFKEETIKDIEQNKNADDIIKLKNEINKYIIRNLKQYSHIKFFNNSINEVDLIITHGGIVNFDSEGFEKKYSTQELIKGIGDYGDEIGLLFNNNHHNTNVYQIHGHRKVEDDYEHSIGLENSVEYGGYLKYVVITKDLTKEKIYFEIKKIKNNVFNKKTNEGHILTNDSDINKILLDKDVKIKDLGKIYSLNFKREVFEKNRWTPRTLKTRGLFIEKETGKVIMRSFNKFFNYNENELSDKNYLKSNLKFPVIAYKKHNGFLGLLSWYDNDLIFASKSTTSSVHVDIFKNLFYQLPEILIEKIKFFLKNNNVTMVFEVCDSQNDKQHIIYYDKPKLFLLKIINNNLSNKEGCAIDKKSSDEYFYLFMDFINADNKIKNTNYENVIKFKPEFWYDEKDNFIYYDFEELDKAIIECYNSNSNIEGAVFCDVEGRMFKVKTNFYRKLKIYREYFIKIKKGENKIQLNNNRCLIGMETEMPDLYKSLFNDDFEEFEFSKYSLDLFKLINNN